MIQFIGIGYLLSGGMDQHITHSFGLSTSAFSTSAKLPQVRIQKGLKEESLLVGYIQILIPSLGFPRSVQTATIIRRSLTQTGCTWF